MVRKADFNPDIPLPPGLTTIAIQKAIDFIEKELTDLIEIYLEQANVFTLNHQKFPSRPEPG